MRIATIVTMIFLAATGLQAQGTSGTFANASRLDMIANVGTVTIEGWARPDVEVSAKHSDRIQVEIKGGPTVEIREHRPPRASLERVDYLIRVPVSLAVLVTSDGATITVRGVHGDLVVDANHSRIEVSDAGSVRLNSGTGDVVVESAAGRVSLHTTAGSLTGRRLRDAVTAETVGGTVTLHELTGASVRVTSTAGDIDISGTPQPDGLYDIASQSGTVTLRLPATVSARVSYGTVRGQVRTNLPQDGATRTRDGRVGVAVGDGSARIEIITFRGDIVVWRGPAG